MSLLVGEDIQQCKNIVSHDDYVRAANAQQRAEYFKTQVLVIAPPILALIALLISLGFLTLCIVGLVKKRLPKKRFVFLISRTASDIFCTLFIIGLSVVGNANSTTFAIVAVFLFIATMSFTSLTFNYVSLSVLHFIAVKAPVFYTNSISPRKCSVVVVLVWMTGIIYSAMFTPLLSSIFMPTKMNSACDYSTCQQPLMFGCISVIVCCLLTCLSTYGIMLYQLKKFCATGSGSGMKRYKNQAMMGINIGVYTISSLPVLGGAIVTLANLTTYYELRDHSSDNDVCYILRFLNELVQLEIVAGCIVIGWTLRIIVDPCVQLATDRALHQLIRQWSNGPKYGRGTDDTDSVASVYSRRSWASYREAVELKQMSSN
uniref:G-protein coupled receptors family 1 profile domain-containing protein n=1 Tax=Plectus sambesii TaxID=2011161 RepID=A0A914W706_9BILA